MRLLLDIGNTRIKWARQSNAGLSQQQAIALVDLSATQLETRVFASDQPITQVLVSNVAGEALAEQVRQAARECWQLDPLFVVSSASATIAGRTLHNAYNEPVKLGVDRWLAMLGAVAMSPVAALVVSVGTAMTLDAVVPDATNNTTQHLGGLIAPGPDLMIQSLMHNTSDIATRAQQGQHGEHFFADNTLGCVYQGAVHAVVALIEAAHTRLRTTQEDARLLITGGAAAQIQPHLATSAQAVPDLVLRGLAALS